MFSVPSVEKLGSKTDLVSSTTYSSFAWIDGMVWYML